MSKLQKFYTNIFCLLLFVKHLTLKRKLSVKSLFYTNRIAITGNRAELNWETVGCHKIYIQGFGILSGITSGAKIILEEGINSITIEFFGIDEQKEVKDILIQAESISLVDKFLPSSYPIQPKSPPFFQQNFKTKAVSTFQFKASNVTISKRLKIISPTPILKFKPFMKSNYLIKS